MLTGNVHHYPNYAFQDDGFGNLIFTPSAQFAMNFAKYMQGEF